MARHLATCSPKRWTLQQVFDTYFADQRLNYASESSKGLQRPYNPTIWTDNNFVLLTDRLHLITRQIVISLTLAL